MERFVLGPVVAEPLSGALHLVAPAVAERVVRLGLGDEIGVFALDPALSDTAATRDAYGLDPAALVNCVVVGGRREGQERLAACLVPSTARADVNGVVRRRLDVRKASFLPQDDAVARTGMEHGGITPLGLPDDWPLLVDAAVAALPLALVGSGVRASKLLVPGAVLAALPGAEVVDGLGRPV